MDSHKEMQFGHQSLQAHRSTGKRSRQETGSRKNLKKKLENGSTSGDGMDHRQSPPRPSLPPPQPPPLLPRPSLSSTSDVQEGDKKEDQSRPQKRTRLVWTLELHKRFVDAVEFLGECDAVPTNILRVMGVDGITRAHIASHLQKYRCYKKEMQANSHGDSSNPGPGERTPIPPTSEEMFHDLRWAAVEGSVSKERRYSGSFKSFFSCFRRFAFSKNEESEKPKEGTEDLSNCVQGGTTSFVKLLKDIQGDRSFVQLLNDIQGGGSFVQSPLPPPPGFGPRLCSGAPPLPNVVEYMKQEIEIMESKLEKEGNSLSPETRENLEKEIRSFTEKYSSIFGSSSFK